MTFRNQDVDIYNNSNIRLTREQKQVNLLKRYKSLLDIDLIKRDKKRYFLMLDEIRKEILRQGYSKEKSLVVLCDYHLYSEIALVLMLMRDDIQASYAFWSVEDISEIWWGRKSSKNLRVLDSEAYESIEDVKEEVVFMYQGKVVHSIGNYHLDDIVSSFFSRRIHSAERIRGNKPVNYFIAKTSMYDFNNSYLYADMSRMVLDVTMRSKLGIIDLNGLLARTGLDVWYLGDSSLVSHIYDYKDSDYVNPNKGRIGESESVVFSQPIIGKGVKTNVDDLY